MAHAVMKALLAERGLSDWTVDSCGTGSWHVGKDADPRTRAVLKRQGISHHHRARQLEREDFRRFDWLLAMDEDNLIDLESAAPNDARAALALLGDYDPHGRSEVPDPYYGGDDGFDRVYELVLRCCTSFLDHHGTG